MLIFLVANGRYKGLSNITVFNLKLVDNTCIKKKFCFYLLHKKEKEIKKIMISNNFYAKKSVKLTDLYFRSLQKYVTLYVY